MKNKSQKIKFSEKVIIYRQPKLINRINKLDYMKILEPQDYQQLIKSERENEYSILIISIEESDIINMALTSCKYRYLFIMNLQQIKDDKFSRQNNKKFMEVLQINNFNEKLQKVFLEYQKSLIKQRTTLQVEKSYIDQRNYINIIYYQRFLKYGDFWINDNKQSEVLKRAIRDFGAESESYINRKYQADREIKQIQREELKTIVSILQNSVNEEFIMDKLLQMYTKETYFYLMLQEYLRCLSIKNLYYIRLPMYYCLRGMQTNQKVVDQNVELFRGQYVKNREAKSLTKQKVGCKNIMLPFQSCSTETIARGFIREQKKGLEQFLFEFKNFTLYKEPQSDFQEMEKCLGAFLEVVLESKKKIDNQRVYSFKNEIAEIYDNQFGELKKQKKNIMGIFKMPYKHTQLIQAEFSLMYDKDPQFVIDILENEQFEGLDEAIRLSKLQIAYRMKGYLSKAIEYGEKAFLLSQTSVEEKEKEVRKDMEKEERKVKEKELRKVMEKVLQLRMELAWAYMDDQQFFVSFQRYRDCFFSRNNMEVDFRAQILNNLGKIYQELGQYKKAEKCLFQSKAIKDSQGTRYNLMSRSIARFNSYYAKFLVLQNQDQPKDKGCQEYIEILDQLLISISEKAIVRQYCDEIDLRDLYRISILLLEMEKIKECQDYCDFVNVLITQNNNDPMAGAVLYHIQAKLMIHSKNYEQADEYFQKAIKYLMDGQLSNGIELLRIYSDYEDFCLKLDKMDQAIICRNEYLRVSSFLLNQILKIRKIVTLKEEQLILEGKFK